MPISAACWARGFNSEYVPLTFINLAFAANLILIFATPLLSFSTKSVCPNIDQ